MTKFTNLAAQRVKPDATAEYTFFGIAGMEPTLEVRHATDANPDFLNHVLRKPKRLQRQAARAKKATPEAIEQARREDIQLFADVIVVGWSDVIDDEGTEVDFSRENLIDFLTALPPDMFNLLRNFCLNINNFRDEIDVEMDEDEEEDLKGN